MNRKLAIFSTAILLTTTSISNPAQAENLQDVQQLLSSKECEGCDLKDAGLFLANLVGAKLSGADLSRANLSRANLAGADLSGANLSGTSLNGANLTGANLSGANLTGADLRDAFLVNAQLFGVSLSSTYVQGAIGIPQYAGTPEDFYAWGVVEGQRGNYQGAIEKFNQVVSIKPDFAAAFLARGVSRYKLGDEEGAIADAEVASELFNEQGNTKGYQAAQNLIEGIKIAQTPPETGGGGSSIGKFLVSVGSLLFKLLSPF
ncbi:MAG: pentapeptide repeat-containing protein [Coleofasciculaceae cyanobacterium]